MANQSPKFNVDTQQKRSMFATLFQHNAKGQNEMSAKVTFKRPSLEMEIEVGSLSELAGYITDEASTLTKVFGSDIGIVVKSLADTTTKEEVAAEGAPATDNTPEMPAPNAPAADAAAPVKDKPKRGRPSNKAIAEATAPAPLEVPAEKTAPPAPPAAPTAVDTGIPAFLDRRKEVAPPAPPPAPPVALPTGILAGKIIAATDKYKEAGKEEMILNWLIGTGIVQAGATYDEAAAVIRLLPDAKLGSVATALSVA